MLISVRWLKILRFGEFNNTRESLRVREVLFPTVFIFWCKYTISAQLLKRIYSVHN